MATKKKDFNYKTIPQQRPSLNKRSIEALALMADYVEHSQLESMRKAAEAGLTHRDKETLEIAVRWCRNAGLWYASKRVGDRPIKGAKANE